MRSFQGSFAKNNQRLVPKQQLVVITFSMLFIILLDCIWTEHQGLIATLSLVGALPLTFYLATYTIKINLKRISNVLDPRLWLPLSYVIYFVAMPCVSILFDSKYSMYNDEIPQIMLSTILGIASLQLGLHIIKPTSESIQKETRLDRYSATFLLLFALILHLYYWYWRIENGFFFTHGRGYIPIPNIITGVRDLLGMSVTYIPLYILAVAFRNGLWKKRITLCFFVIYACGTLALFFLAGQIRPLFFFFLMILASSGYMSQIKKIRWGRTSAGILILFVSCIFFIYSARYLQSQIHQEENQLGYILLNLPSIVEKGREIAETSGGMKSLPLQRIFMPQEFFLQTVRALNENSSYGYGSYTMTNLPLIVPRLLWPGKGMIDDTEVLIQQNVLYTNPYDISLTPLTQFYAEGNIVGILIGFFLLGLISSYAHKACFSINNRIGGLVCWVVILYSIIQLENNIPIYLLLGIRNGLIFVALAFVISILHSILAKAVRFVPKYSPIPK
jgi:hypothetical protein